MMYFLGKAGTTIWENLRIEDRAVLLSICLRLSLWNNYQVGIFRGSLVFCI